MKVSQSVKEKTKQKILNEAITLIIEKGYKQASMREIAKNAGVSNPTIYNYFPTKERLIFTYLEQKHKETLEILENIEGFETYTLREQLQALIETELELYLEEREFLLEISDIVFHDSGFKLDMLYESKNLFIDAVREIMLSAIESGEIEKPPFHEYLPKLFWDYFIVIITYWIKDNSERFENTTQFIDHSMSVVETLLQSGFLNKASDFGLFLFKTHLMGHLEKNSLKARTLSTLKEKLKGLYRGTSDL